MDPICLDKLLDDLKNASVLKNKNTNQDYSRNSKTQSVNSANSDNDNEVSLNLEIYVESSRFLESDNPRQRKLIFFLFILVYL